MPNKNKEYELTVEDLNSLGYGVARLEGKVVFVAGAVDGDRVRAKIILDKKDYAVARTEAILSPSPYREPKPRCSVKGCGGCAYGAVTDAHALELKQNTVKDAFRRVGLPDVQVAKVTPSPDPWHYRNKAQYPVAKGKGGCVVGFFAPKSHRVVEAADCPLQAKAFAPVIAFLRAFFDANGIEPYCEEDGTGLLRHIYLRHARKDGSMILTLVVRSWSVPHLQKLAEALQAEFPEITSFLLNCNPKDTNVICGEEYRTVYGTGWMEDELCGVSLRITPDAFFQVNPPVAEAIYRKAGELAALQGTESLADLYCGTGSIGLSLAHRVRQVVGVEIVPEAVACAKENARRNGVKNASFYLADAGNGQAVLSALQMQGLHPDVVILDPPRKGSTEELLSKLAEEKVEKIVYVSCNPQTLARDVKFLLPLGYKLSTVYPFDMFPHTGHVETVCLLSKLHTGQHIEVELNLDEMDLTTAESKATYDEIKEYVLENTGLKVSQLYIAQIKRKYGIIERANYNLPKSENAKVPNCPPDKEAAIVEALKHFGMIK